MTTTRGLAPLGSFFRLKKMGGKNEDKIYN
jgi:hypothetical protein